MLIRNLLWSFRGMKIVTWSLSRNGRSEAVELFSGFSKIEDPENRKWTAHCQITFQFEAFGQSSLDWTE